MSGGGNCHDRVSMQGSPRATGVQKAEILLEGGASPRNVAAGEVVRPARGRGRNLNDDDLGGMSSAGDGTWVRGSEFSTAYRSYSTCRRQPSRSDLDQSLPNAVDDAEH